MTYADACDAAATQQGLDPITDVLRGAGIPHTVDQTGGFCMCVNVPLVEGGSEYLYLTDACGVWTAAEPGDVAICRYWETEPCRWGECYADVTERPVPLGYVVDIVRRELRSAPEQCPNRGESWHA